ncbi:ATP-binding protein [[Clostridium] sordellii]|nr:ATP-binding protein [[Clostridium] sordellii] [Paeniclostridium sordellii]
MIHLYTLLTNIGIYLSFINIYDFKRNKIKLATCFICLYILLALISYYLKISPLYGVNIINAILVYKFTKKTLLTITIPLMSTVLYITVNTFYYHVVLFLTSINIYKLGNRIHLMAHYLITYIIIIVISKLLNSKLVKIIDEFDMVYKFKIQLLIILTSILSICIYFETIRQTKLAFIAGLEIKRNIMLCLLHFFTFLSVIFLIMLVNNQSRLKEINEYNSKLESLTNEMRKFRHDYKNIILSMCGYIDAGDMEGLREFFYSNIECSAKNLDIYNLNFSSVGNIKCIEAKGMIASKLIMAQRKGIDTNVYIPNIVKDINFNCLDLCRILGIILDNSIEASLECENPSITLSIIDKENLISIIISNTYKEKIEDISNLFKDGYSSKGEGRGIGLSNLRKILNNYENVYFTIKIEGEFIQKLDIYK